ncbi:MAG: bifunctional diguanylate cyclase/phosphodiesterase [Candidatus Thiodiazotropha sp. L084R]
MAVGDNIGFSESLSDVILEATGDGILVVDRDGNVILHNSRFAELWRKQPELILSSNIQVLLNFIWGQLSDPIRVQNKLVEIHNQPEVEGYDALIFKDGRVFEYCARPARQIGQKLARAWSFQDVTQTVNVQQKHLKEIAFRNAILKSLPDLVWLKNSSGTYLACNKRFEDFFGADEKEIIGKTDYDFVDAELANFFRKHDLRAMKKGCASFNEERITFAKDGHKELLETTKRPLYDHENNVIGILGIGHDITKIRESEERLKHSEERLSLAIQGTNEGIWDWNLETDEIYYSPRWKEILGYRDDELHNNLDTWKNLVHPDDKKRVLNKIVNYLNSNNKQEKLEIQMRMQHKENRTIFVQSHAIRLFHKGDGKPIRLVATHIDITERKRAEITDEKNTEILEMIAVGKPAADIYNAIALMYEERHPGMRCSLLELHDNKLMHGGAPSLPKAYCEAIHGLEFGPNIGSCGTSTYTGKRVIVEDIDTDPKWAMIKEVALPHGMRCCWSEPIKNSSGKVLGAFGMYYNHPAQPNAEESNDLRAAARLASIVMERDQNLKRIQELAYVDELTGLASRFHFYQTLNDFIKSSHRHQRRFSLLYIDLDDFKYVNDSLGHDIGDQLLKVIGQRLLTVARDVDFVARLSGDEFCILVEDIPDDIVSANVAKRCLEIISKPLDLSSRMHIPACSIGIANYPEDGKNASSLLKAADTSLYAAKEQGKNRFAFYKVEMTHEAEYRFQFEQYLRDAIEKQQLNLVYQPQINLTTGQVIGVEALCRWQHPLLGPIPPTDFIHVAEQIGMIKSLTEWVLYTACLQNVRWQKDGLPLLRMSVNISPSLFLDLDLVTLVKQVITNTDMDPTLLELEVTETAVQTDQDNLEIFTRLQEAGIKVAIDDFGTGYSSIASLKHLRVDSLKIDKYFIDDMLHDKKSQYLVNTMIEMGHSLGHSIIAEGIETKAQLELLKKMNCDNAQGYLFSKPIAADELPMLLSIGIPS